MIAALEAMHGEVHWHWDARSDPFAICAGAILVQHTAWTNAERAVEALRAAGYLDPARVAGASPETVAGVIRPAGSQARKARALIALAQLAEAAGGLSRLLAREPSGLRAELLAIAGIGPETADCIVLYAAQQPAFVIDAYTIRLFGRLMVGPDAGAGYTAWQHWFEAQLPRDAAAWARLHALIVLHGKALCRARWPKCGSCLLAPVCSVPAGASPDVGATLPA